MDKSESKIQQEIVQWYRNTYCLKHHNPRCMIFSIPNEGRGAASAQLIATGLYPGCADLCVMHQWISTDSPFDDEPIIPYQKNEVLFLECKTDSGVQSDKQKSFAEHCQSMQIGYHIVRSLDDFKRVIESL